MVEAYLELSPYTTLSELSLVLYDVSVTANTSQLGGMNYTTGTVVVEVRDTTYTCMYYLYMQLIHPFTLEMWLLNTTAAFFRDLVLHFK